MVHLGIGNLAYESTMNLPVGTGFSHSFAPICGYVERRDYVYTSLYNHIGALLFAVWMRTIEQPVRVLAVPL